MTSGSNHDRYSIQQSAWDLHWDTHWVCVDGVSPGEGLCGLLGVGPVIVS